jgi:hypothetical protein
LAIGSTIWRSGSSTQQSWRWPKRWDFRVWRRRIAGTLPPLAAALSLELVP